MEAEDEHLGAVYRDAREQARLRALEEPRVPQVYDEEDDRAFRKAMRAVERLLPPDVQPKFRQELPPRPPVGYSDRPMKTRVVALDKRKYTHQAAIARFAELREAQSLKLWGEPFITGRHYCWRVLA